MVYVSQYEEEFTKAFRDSLDDLDAEPFEQAVKKIVDKVIDDVTERVRDDVRDNLLANIMSDVCAKAAEVASRYIEDALAGDDKKIRNLLGLYIYPGAYQFHRWGDRPTRWKLIEAMIDRRPDLFVDERLSQLNGKVAVLEKDVDHWRGEANKLRAEIASLRGYA